METYRTEAGISEMQAALEFMAPVRGSQEGTIVKALQKIKSLNPA